MIFTNMARFLSVSVTELTVKAPKAIIEVKDLKLDVSKKNGGSSPVLNIKLYIIPFTVQICDPRPSYNQSSSYNQVDRLLLLFVRICLLHVNCEFATIRKEELKIRNLDVVCGDVALNLNENLLLKNTTKSGTSSGADAFGGTASDSSDKRS